ncbi:tetratricopeptide repeat protein [Ensifer sp. SL37]|uniref:tetratricopeptide repeat protein n=1 Tax=Ensifer sp. SL37 TaxID=2995137 RepID=UPI002275CE45|nr:tetratricopeptide repeat protein [Ensifer sp. SL37]MCY1740506.1 tetratricopeptide repeat protein [Ensifer sp. SL37]
MISAALRKIVLRTFSLASIVALAACASANSTKTSMLAEISVGEQFLENGQYERGYSILTAVAEANPSSSVAVLALADAYYRQNAVLKASGFYQKAIELGATKGGRLGLAKIELARNNAQSAIEQLKMVLASEPESADALNGMGVAHDLVADHNAAQAFYRRVLSRDPSDKRALNNLALSLALSGKATAALPSISELSRSNLSDKTVRQNLAIIQYLSGATAQAVKTATIDLEQADAENNFRALGYSLPRPGM